VNVTTTLPVALAVLAALQMLTSVLSNAMAVPTTVAETPSTVTLLMEAVPKDVTAITFIRSASGVPRSQEVNV
jgi:hypothetical protein